VSTFSDTIKLTVDVIAGQTQSFKGFLGNLKSDLSDAEGGFNKFKVAGGGAMSFVSNNAAGLAAGAGAAVAAFAVSAISDFQELAGEVGNFRDALGLTSDEASRWVEVAGDLGIGADKLEKSMGLMLRTAASSPQVFKDLGVQIAYAKDGSVDANGTFLNVIARLNAMPDPAARAAAAQKLLGRAWMDSAELIQLGADGVKARLDEVSGAKILSDDQIAQSREFRDAMDDLGDRVDKIKNQVATALIPILTDLAGVVGPVIDGFGKLRSAMESIHDIPIVGSIVTGWINPLQRFKDVLDAMPTDDEIHDRLFGEGMDDIEASLSPELIAKMDAANDAALRLGASVDIATGFFAGHVVSVEDAAAAEKAAADAVKEHDARQKNIADTLSDVNAKIQETIERLLALHEESVNAADATLNAEDAQRKFGEAVAASTEVNKDAKSTADDKADAVANERDAMIDAAKAAEAKTDADAKANGVTATGTQKIDAFNSSLLINATQATPAARDAITDYILEANGVPASKGTDIRAAIAAGDFNLAAQLLAGLSAPRNAAIQAEATNVAATARTLDDLARSRTAPIRASFTGGAQQSGAIGGTQDPRYQSTVGEYGREVVDWRLGRPKVIPRAESANLLGRQNGGDSYTININGSDAREGVFEFERWMWLRNAQPGRG
jgi:hypothetical protein